MYHVAESIQIKTVTKETDLELKRLKKELRKANESLSKAESKLDIYAQFICYAPELARKWEAHRNLKKQDWEYACFPALVEAEKWKNRQGAKRGPKGLSEGERLRADYTPNGQ